MKDNKDLYMVAIGASTGGVEAINQLFKEVALDTEMSYIICENSQEDIKNNIVQLLKYQTDLKVEIIEQGMKIYKNTVYIVPDDKYVEINKNIFELYNKNNSKEDSIDRLFISLAKEKKDKVVGIILSGTGKDGVDGILAIHKEQGLVIVQNEDSCEFSESPRNAATTGIVDYVLPPSQMILAIINHRNNKVENEVDIDSKGKDISNLNKEQIKIVVKELVKSNGELQSINESLKLLNDELYMVNNEYKSKLDEVVQSKENIEELIKISEFNVIQLDNSLCIERFTACSIKIMSLTARSIGTPVYNVENSFLDFNLYEVSKEVLHDMKEKEDVVKDRRGAIYRIKIMPKIDSRNKVESIIINIVDITNIIEDNYLGNKLKLFIERAAHNSDDIRKIDATYIKNNQERIAELIMQTHYEKVPQLRKLYTEETHKRCISDILRTLNFLSLSINCNDSNLFMSYVKWLRIVLKSYGVPSDVFRLSFELTLEILQDEGELDKVVQHTLKESFVIVNQDYKKEIYISKFDEYEDVCKTYLDYLLNINRQGANRLILQMYHKENMSIEEIYLKIIQPVMHEVGELWQRSMITVAQEHYCSSTTQGVLEMISMEIPDANKHELVFLGACVSKELHEIGGRMVSDFFKIGGWKSYYLGANTPESGLIDFIKGMKVDVLGLSATMMHHVEEVKDMIQRIREDEECKHVKIIVGGYIFNQSSKLWKYVGADGYGKDAKESYDVACSLVENNKIF